MRVSEMLGIEQVPAGFSDQLGSLQNVTLCDLYTRSTDEGFVGHCEVKESAGIHIKLKLSLQKAPSESERATCFLMWLANC